MRREFSLRLVSGISTYWFDLFGNWFQGEAIFESITQMREMWEQQARPREESAAEVAVLVDAESMYYLDGEADFQSDHPIQNDDTPRSGPRSGPGKG